jgi:hypothetical protein
MSDSSTKESERSSLLFPEQSNSDTSSRQSFPDLHDLDAEAPLLEDVRLPSPAKHDVTVLSGTLIIVSLGVLVFLQGTIEFLACLEMWMNVYLLSFDCGSV